MEYLTNKNYNNNNYLISGTATEMETLKRLQQDTEERLRQLEKLCSGNEKKSKKSTQQQQQQES